MLDTSNTSIKEKIPEVLSRTRKLLSGGKGARCEVEVYFFCGRSLDVCFSERGVTNRSISEIGGVAVRCVVDRSIGFAYTSSFDRRNLQRLISDAIKNAKMNSPLERWEGFPFQTKTKRVLGLFDKRLSPPPIDEIVVALRSIFALSKKRMKSRIQVGGIIIDDCVRGVANTNGLELVEVATLNRIFLSQSMQKNGSPVFSLYNRNFSHFADIDYVSFVQEMSQLMNRFSYPKNLRSFAGTILLGKRAVGKILHGLARAFYANHVLYRLSLLCNKRFGDQLTSEKVTLVDDGVLPGGESSLSFDDEGTPTKRTFLITKGVFSNLLHNLITAYQTKEQSTGNGLRRFNTEPNISSTNLYLVSGGKSLSEMISEIDKGLLIEDISGDLSVSTGNLYGVVSTGFLIKDGKAQTPVKGLTFTKNILDLLRKVKEIGKEKIDSKPTENILRLEDIKLNGD